MEDAPSIPDDISIPHLSSLMFESACQVWSVILILVYADASTLSTAYRVRPTSIGNAAPEYAKNASTSSTYPAIKVVRILAYIVSCKSYLTEREKFEFLCNNKSVYGGIRSVLPDPITFGDGK